ncbi:RNA polymerase sigma-70 factor, ECF subfamily [Parapedobacter composti]|uniref:RNA polymerase sigma-70 factor, ECF subfamily n=1 Tax=Parapedobacter composti TaxID=623281 RepID=A0A1I1IMB2_9SPHI|nr:RNA polymerase sigma-70 factor [Parapedobacter composti]SFC36862.1 RNA polymerase sigma-70 factor, ECF subfamily [Parapedobacter composti]
MGTYGLHIERVLLQQIAEGEEVAFKKLFELYKTKIFNFVVSYTHSDADAEEIVQDTFMTLWFNKGMLATIQHPRNYIYTVARNKTLNHLQRIARSEVMMEQVWANMQWQDSPVEELLDAKECGELLNRALAKLPDQRQAIFNLSRVEGLSHEEIAAKVGLSKSRVKNIIVDTLKYLRLHLSKHHVVLIALLTVLSACS